MLVLIKIALNYLLGCSQETPPPTPLSENAKGFLATLEHSGEEELTLHLQDRMHFSKEAVACLVCVFDRLHSHIDSMCKQVQAAGICGNTTVIFIFCKLLKHKETTPSKIHYVFHIKTHETLLFGYHNSLSSYSCDINVL